MPRAMQFLIHPCAALKLLPAMLRRYAISQHPEVEARIMAELRALGVMPSAEHPQARELTYADTCELTYLQAVIKVRPLHTLEWVMGHPAATTSLCILPSSTAYP